MAHPLGENAGLDLDMRGSTFLLEAKMAHPLSENAGLDLEMRVSTLCWRQNGTLPKRNHDPRLFTPLGLYDIK